MTEQTPFAPVRKLDAGVLLQTLNAETGTNIELIGPAPGGEAGAAFVRWPDGRDGVLTHNGMDMAILLRTSDILRLARTRGIPVPRYDLLHELPDGAVIIQERLPGAPPHRIDDRLIRAMIALNDQFADLLVERPDVPPLDLYLLRSGPGFCLHESLAAYDWRTQRLLDQIRAVGQHPAAVMTGDDLVHADFHPGNTLVDESGTITGVIDWDGLSRGDRHCGLVTLAFDLGWGTKFGAAHREVSAESMRLIDERLDAMNPDTLRAYWAHMSLRLVDWSIRHYSAEVVDHYLAFASSRFDL